MPLKNKNISLKNDKKKPDKYKNAQTVLKKSRGKVIW